MGRLDQELAGRRDRILGMIAEELRDTPAGSPGYVLLERAWGRVHDDLSLTGARDCPDSEMLRHLSGECFMTSLAQDGHAMRARQVMRELGTDDENYGKAQQSYRNMKGTESFFVRAADICDEMRVQMQSTLPFAP